LNRAALLLRKVTCCLQDNDWQHYSVQAKLFGSLQKGRKSKANADVPSINQHIPLHSVASCAPCTA
jgi:hypothetical protein